MANTIFIEVELDDQGSPKLKSFAEKSERSLKKAGDASERFERRTRRSFAGIGRSIGPLLGIAGFAGLVAGLGKAASASVSAASMLENYEVRLVSLRGSQKAASESLEFFRSVASKVPQTFQEVAEAGVTLEAMTNRSKELLPVTADLATVMGLTLPEAASALGRAYSAGAGAADIFRERGILNIIKDAKGIDDLTKLTLPEFRKAMVETFTDPDGKIAGAAKRLTETWTGQLSMLKDSFFDLAANIGEALLPVMKDLVTNHLKPMVQGVSAWVKENKELIKQKIENTIEAIGTTITQTRKIIDPFIEQLKQLFLVALTGWQRLPLVVKEVGLIGALIGGAKGALALGALVTAIGLIERAIGITTRGLDEMKSNIIPLNSEISKLQERQSFLLDQMNRAKGNEEALSRIRGLLAKNTEALRVAQEKLGNATMEASEAANLQNEAIRVSGEASASLVPEIERVAKATIKASGAAKLFRENWKFTAENIIDDFHKMTRADDDFWENLEKNREKETKVFQDSWKFTAEEVQDGFHDMTRANDDFEFTTKRSARQTGVAWQRAGSIIRAGFSDAVFNTITGRFDRLKDVGMAVADALARAFADMVTQILIDLARLALARFFGIGGGPISGGIFNSFFGFGSQSAANTAASSGLNSLFGGGTSAAAGLTAGTTLPPATAAATVTGGIPIASLGPAGLGGVPGTAIPAAGASAASAAAIAAGSEGIITAGGIGGIGTTAPAVATGAAAATGVAIPAVAVAFGVAQFIHTLLTQKPTPKLVELAGGNIARLGSLASFRVFSSLPTFFPENLVAPPTPAELEAGLRFNQQSAIASSNMIGNALAHIFPPGGTIPTAEGLWRQVFLEFAEQADPNAPVHPFVSDLVSRITFAAKGFNDIVTRPTLFMAGEGGRPEHVKITPGGRAEGGMTVHISFPNSVISSKRDLLRIVQPSIDIALKRAARSKFQKAAL